MTRWQRVLRFEKHGFDEQRGFRTRAIVVVTTLLNPVQTTKEELAFRYRDRWNNELDLRSIQSPMQMDQLRCKTPELVHKEVWTHILADNLIRTLMAQVACRHAMEPRTISFQGALQTLEAFRPLLDFQEHRGNTFRTNCYEQLLQAIASHRVGNRPDRFEPRKVKRNRPKLEEMREPRQKVKRRMEKGHAKI